MSIKNFIKISSVLVVIIVLQSCSGVRKVAYFQERKSDNKRNSTIAMGLYEAIIKPKDLLSITVVSSDPEASKIYNLVVPQVGDPGAGTSLYSQPTLQTYLVDNDGYINFPILGKLKAGGYTVKQFQSELAGKLAPAFSKEMPVITIRITNYYVNVLGEVKNPGKYTTNNEQLTIFDALALAGDMTIYGRRDNVKVLRENADGSKTYYTVNLEDKNIVNSPVYYLEQDDVVYVEPNNSKSRSANFGAAESFGVSALSVLFSLASLIITALK